MNPCDQTYGVPQPKDGILRRVLEGLRFRADGAGPHAEGAREVEAAAGGRRPARRLPPLQQALLRHVRPSPAQQKYPQGPGGAHRTVFCQLHQGQ
jgi:hypothetical protein